MHDIGGLKFGNKEDSLRFTIWRFFLGMTLLEIFSRMHDIELELEEDSLELDDIRRKERYF